MERKAWAHEVRAFTRYRSADGTEGATALQAGIQFKNGLYTGGTFSAAGLPLTTDNITISGTAGNGYIQYAAQSARPSLALAHTYVDSSGNFAIGRSGSSAYDAIFTNGLMTADRSYAFPNKGGTFAMTDDNISQFTNDARYVVGPSGAVADRITTFDGTTGKLVKDSGIAISSVVLNTRLVSAGTGLSGGGDLSADRTISMPNVGTSGIKTFATGDSITTDAQGRVSAATTVTRTLTEGAGLAGNTYDLSANRTLAMGTPGTLSIASTNAVSGTTHSHVITSSSNPGAAASLLATDGSGFLTLVRMTATGYAFVNAATANLYLKDTSTGFQAATTLVITPQSGNTVRNTAYTSGLVGWNIPDSGNVEFNNADIRGAIHAGIISYNQIQTTAGTFLITKSAAKLKSDVTIPASPTYGTTTVNIDVVDADGITHAASQLFATNDVLRLKDGLTGDTWFTVSSASDQTTFWRYVCKIQAGTSNVTYRAGLGVPDFGTSGYGFIMLTADQTNAPYLQMATHAGTFSSANSSGTLVVTPQLRLGNLNGSYGYASDIYGLGAGQYGAASRSWVTVDQTNGLRIGNNTTTLGQWYTSGQIDIGEDAAGKSYITIDQTSGVRLANGADIRLQLRMDGSGFLANSHIAWDASGNITIDGNATIAGWTVNSTYFAKDTGTNSTSSGMAPLDYSFYAGSTYANRATAPFRVTPAGALTATSATITGAITASSGSITGPLTMGGASGSISLGTTPPTSATVGTGIWLDRTGLYSLSSNTQNIVIDANGVTAAAGNVILDANGLRLTPGTALLDVNAITWYDGGKRTGILSNYYTGGVATGYVEAKGEASGDTAVLKLLASNDLGVASGIVITRTPRSGTNKGYLNIGSSATWITVGDATAVPTHVLDVYGTGWFQSDLTVGDGGTGTTLRQLILNGGSGTGGGPQITFQANSVTGCAIGTERAIAGGSTSSTKATLYSSDSTYRLYGMGAGTLSTDASGNVTASSDEQLKTRIRKFRKGLATIIKLEPIIYRHNKKSGLDRKNDYVGFGARHTKKHIPEAVGKGKNGFHTMSDRAILATLVNAVKELEEIVCH
jgi:hypothetical protein